MLHQRHHLQLNVASRKRHIVFATDHQSLCCVRLAVYRRMPENKPTQNNVTIDSASDRRPSGLSNYYKHICIRGSWGRGSDRGPHSVILNRRTNSHTQLNSIRRTGWTRQKGLKPKTSVWKGKLGQCVWVINTRKLSWVLFGNNDTTHTKNEKVIEPTCWNLI